MHSGKRKGEDLNGSTLTPPLKRRTATETAVTAMDVMTSSPPTAKKDPPTKKAPECAMMIEVNPALPIFVKEWEVFTKKHPDFQEISFLPAFWDFTKKHSDFKAKGLAALLTVPSQWLHKYIVDNEGKKLSPKALDGLLLLVAKDKKDLVLFLLDFCKDICNGEEECTLKIPHEPPDFFWGRALLEASKLQLVRCMMQQSSHLRVEFKIADMIFLFRELMEVDKDFADIVSLFKKNRWYYFTEDADGATGSSMPALKRMSSVVSDGSSMPALKRMNSVVPVKENEVLPITLVKHVQSFKQHSEYPCQYNVLLECGDYGEHDELGETRQYSATIEFVLHPNLQPEYRRWVDRTFNRVVNDYVGQHPEDTEHPDKFFISEDDGKLIFTYLNDHFGWDDGFDKKLYDLKGEMDELMIQVLDACFPAPETAPVPTGGATANNYREQYKLKVRQHRNHIAYALWDEFPRKEFSFILVNNKQIALNKEGLKTSQ